MMMEPPASIVVAAKICVEVVVPVTAVRPTLVLVAVAAVLRSRIAKAA